MGNRFDTINNNLRLTGNTTTTAITGNLSVSGDLQPSTPFALRNRIINGNFEVWQRGTTSRTQGGQGVYSADRWTRMGYQEAAHARVSVTSPPSGLYSRYAMRVSSSTTGEAAGGTRMDLSQKIENANCFDLAGQNVAISFWIRFSAATATSSTATPFSNWNLFLQFNTSTTDSTASTDTGDSVYIPVSITNGSLPTTWTKYTTFAPVPAGTNNISVRCQFQGLGSTASAGTVWYEITDIQLEQGSSATPFERRPYGLELALCQRYFQHLGSGMIGRFSSGTQAEILWQTSIPMRTAPTYTPSSQSVLVYYIGVNSSTTSAITASNNGGDNTGGVVLVNLTWGLSPPGGAFIGTPSKWLFASAEL